MCGNTSETVDVGGAPGKRCLFFLTVRNPGIRLSGDRVGEQAEHLRIWDVWFASYCP